MKIGILTYYKVANFGANLQAVSTYLYLKGKGYEPVFVNYCSKEVYNKLYTSDNGGQTKCHFAFVDGVIKQQSHYCHNVSEVLNELERLGIEAVIIGSDAVLQHHPFLKRFHKGRRKPIFIAHYSEERLFPNPFWGVGIINKYPVSLMSVSSQNSDYKYFFPWTKCKMKAILSKMKYISVRDTWTFNMLKEIDNQLQVSLTPDPVFAFNQNANGILCTKKQVLEKFKLPDSYVLVSFFGQVFSVEYLDDLKRRFLAQGLECVALPMPTGMHFKHHFNYEIPLPLNPIDWYCLLKYSSGYVGSNMHPIVVCLHNAVPCYSIDNWGRTNFFGKKIDDGSSKVEHILNTFGLSTNRTPINDGKCEVSAERIVASIIDYPSQSIANKAHELLDAYNQMMSNLLKSFER